MTSEAPSAHTAPRTTAPDPAAPEPPAEAEIGARVREAWSAALGHQDFADDEDFFVVGGHSVLVARIMADLGAALGVRLPLRLFFDNATVQDLATAVAARLAPEAAPPC